VRGTGAPYELAVTQRTDDYEEVLWSTADGEFLQRFTDDMFASYENCHCGASQIRFHPHIAGEFLYAYRRQSQQRPERGIVSLLSHGLSYAGDGI
jgi:hypothetical protein